MRRRWWFGGVAATCIALVGISFTLNLRRPSEFDWVVQEIGLPMVGHGEAQGCKWGIFTGPKDAKVLARHLVPLLRQRGWQGGHGIWSYRPSIPFFGLFRRWVRPSQDSFDFRIEEGRAYLYPTEVVHGAWTTVSLERLSPGYSGMMVNFGGWTVYR